MADYYPLLSRAIAGMAGQPEAARQAIYDRAREALERQLRGFDPPLAEAEIESELAALAQTIARVEHEQTPAESTPEIEDAPPFDDTDDAFTPAPPTEPESEAETGLAAVQPMVRPRIPAKVDTEGRKKPLALFAGVALVAMLVMGLIALTRRNSPKPPARPPVIATPAAPVDATKTEGRLAGAESAPRPEQPPAPAPEPARPSPPPAEPSAKAPEAAPEASPVVPATAVSRAFMVLEAQGNAPSQFEGKVEWSFAPDAAIQNQKSLRAMIEFQSAGLKVDFSIARNTDPALNASHTVMVVFDPKGDIGPVREMSAIEWRERESQNGATLAGIVVPVQDNVFMIGLDNADAAVARNLALLQTQKWMVFEIRLANGRRGAVLVEKGAKGDKAVSEALADWK